MGVPIVGKELKASVQYNDMKGTIAVDWADQRGFWRFVSDFGVDTDQYFPFGVNVYRGGAGKSFVSILLVETAAVGGSFDAVQ